MARAPGYNIILDGQDVPVCVIRLVSMRLVRFCDVTEVVAFTETIKSSLNVSGREAARLSLQ